MNYTNLQERVLGSLETIFCTKSSSDQDGQGDHACILRSSPSLAGENLYGQDPLRTEVTHSRQSYMLSEDLDATVLYISVDNFAEESATLPGGTLSWSAWKVSWLVLRLGASIIEDIVREANGLILTSSDIYRAGVARVEGIVVQEVNLNILNGKFDHLMNTLMNGGDIAVSSLSGEEEETLEHFVMPSAASETTNDAKGNTISGLYIALFFAGLGVGFVLVTGLTSVVCRPYLAAMRDDDLEIKETEEQEDLEENRERDSSRSRRPTVDAIYVVDSLPSSERQETLSRNSSSGRRSRADTSSSVMMKSVMSKLDSETWSLPGAEVKWP